MPTAIAATVLLGLAAVSIVAAVLAHRAAERARLEVAEATRLDPLTGLPRREGLVELLQPVLDQAAGSGARVTVLLFELNRFAVVNDLHGPETGDALLVAIAEKVRAGLNPGDRLGRYGGPTFVVISPGAGNAGEAEALARSIQRAISTPFNAGTNQLRILATIGWTVTGGKAATAEEVLADAVLALQEAAERGPGTLLPFEMSLRQKLSPATAERRLQHALEADQFWLMYMPVVDMADNRIVGVEALLRWADPEHGIINPAEFLRALEDTGLIVPVGNWVVEEASRQTRIWQDRYPDRDITTTVNASPRQLSSDDFVNALLRAVDATDVDPGRLCIEITEGAELHDIEETWRRLRLVKNRGVQLALDNFGTGYSSLRYIRLFQLDVLKIERSFVQGLGQTREDQAIVQQMIGLAHNLGLTPVAEGVDTAQQAEVLRSLSCDLAQGYFYSKPQPLEVIERMIERGRLRPGEGARARIDWSGGGPAPGGPGPTRPETATSSPAPPTP